MLQPFDDFNKRTARLIMNWLLIQGGYRPIVFNQRTDKQKYKDAIAAKAAGDTIQFQNLGRVAKQAALNRRASA